jgi:hypothetical protein
MKKMLTVLNPHLKDIHFGLSGLVRSVGLLSHLKDICFGQGALPQSAEGAKYESQGQARSASPLVKVINRATQP